MFNSPHPIQNLFESGAIVILAIPLLALILSQRLFMRSMTIT